jgi:hypothetical protein
MGAFSIVNFCRLVAAVPRVFFTFKTFSGSPFSGRVCTLCVLTVNFCFNVFLRAHFVDAMQDSLLRCRKFFSGFVVVRIFAHTRVDSVGLLAKDLPVFVLVGECLSLAGHSLVGGCFVQLSNQPPLVCS